MEADFLSVWNRVNGAAPPDTPEAQLRRFILSEAEDVCMLRTMLQKVCDNFLCRKLSQVCTEKTRQLKRLRTALYLLASEYEYPTITQKIDRPEPLPALKVLYERVCAAAADYRKAASETDRAALEIVYASLAEAEARHAIRLSECAERLICLNGQKAPL